MLDVFVWWLVLFFIGLAAWPVTFHLFRGQAGRGYAFTRAVGLLLSAYAFWLLASFSLLENTSGAILGLLLGGGAVAWWVLGRRPAPDGATPARWLRSRSSHVLAVEAVFAIAFILFAYYRSFNPDIAATEKPMEFTFLNGILKSSVFPPRDPWLSGFSISYYYFGYVMVALVTRLSGVSSSVGFNLGLTTCFAQSAAVVFGLVFAMVRGVRLPADQGTKPSRSGAYACAVLGVVLLLVIGNLEGFFESAHSAGYGSADFWQLLDINNLAAAPVTHSPIPNDNWWWWRASRIVNDHDPRSGAHVEVIDEFPAFSFLLGDLHPHVLALPFTLLTLALAFEIYLDAQGAYSSLLERRNWPRLLLVALVVGGLGFLNTFDLPTFAFVVVIAYGLARLRRSGLWNTALLLETLKFGVILGGLAVVLYLPFYIAFQSQVRGILPVIYFKTPLQQFLIMFGLFIFIIGALVVALFLERRDELASRVVEAGSYAFIIMVAPLLLILVALLVVALRPDLQAQLASFASRDGSGGVVYQLATDYARTFLGNPWEYLLLGLLMALLLVLLRRRSVSGLPNAAPLESLPFVLLLAFTGLLLTFGVEIAYVRDTFETRMNTVFKLYYQGWTLLAVSSAFGCWYLYNRLGTASRLAFSAVFSVLLGMSLFYPLLAFPNRAENFRPNSAAGLPTLDGVNYIRRFAPDDYAAIDWLNSNARQDSVILEASGPQYSEFDRISMGTGLSTLLGWAGHELQWRGSNEQPTKREPDIAAIYMALDANRASALLKEYKVRYVIVGPREQQKYSLAFPMIDKFKRLGRLAFNRGSTMIFEID